MRKHGVRVVSITETIVDAHTGKLVDSTESVEEELRDTLQRGMDIEAIKYQVEVSGEVLEEGSAAERKAFIKSFLKDIEITGGDAAMRYGLPLVGVDNSHGNKEIVSVVHDGGPDCTEHRTFSFSFALTL